MENNKYYRLPENLAEQIEIQTISYKDKIKLICDRVIKFKPIVSCTLLRIAPDAVVFNVLIYKSSDGIAISREYYVSIALTAINNMPVEAIVMCIKQHIKVKLLEDIGLEERRA